MLKAEVLSQQQPRRKVSSPQGESNRLLGLSGTALKRRLENRRALLLQMGWLEFWEQEEALYRNIETLQKETREIDDRLLPIEKQKEAILASLRKHYRMKSPHSARMGDLQRLQNLMLSIQPLVAKRAKATRELRVLLEEWAIFQEVAKRMVLKESGGSLRKVVTTTVDQFVDAFQRENAEAVSRLLFRGVQVNGRLDRQAYIRRLKNYFERVRVVSFKIENQEHREVNPFTIRVKGQYTIEEVETMKRNESEPHERKRTGDVQFTLRDVGGRWLITEMVMPDRPSDENQSDR